MQSKRSKEFEDRFISFSVGTIKTLAKLPGLPPSVTDQVIRSAASIGANYAEAQNAVSRADFRNKIAISKKDAAETRYWLRIISQLVSPELVANHLQEAQEIVLILQKIITTLQTKSTA